MPEQPNNYQDQLDTLPKTPYASCLYAAAVVVLCIGAVPFTFAFKTNPLLSVVVAVSFGVLALPFACLGYCIQAMCDCRNILLDIRTQSAYQSKQDYATSLNTQQCRIALSGMDDTLDQILAAVTPAPVPEQAAPQAPAE